MIELNEQTERVLLVAVSPDEEAAERSLDELEELVETSGAECAGRVIQRRDTFHPATYVGSGKVEEIRLMIEMTDATGIVCDDELSPGQISNLVSELDTKVMDRTLVILDIFAKRASSAEGKVQVELAQQRYLSTHLAGLGRSLSRLGGGIGTRGPGEKKLEMDRRMIRNRISQLKRELEEIERHRQVTRENRQKSLTRKIAIVGYTNAGKSTLLNTLTNAEVLEEDKLFATLDPTTRTLELERGQQILLTDTVGFIHKLPHHLVDAFRSTLEEAKYADDIIHVVDASNPQMEEQMRVVYETLQQLGVTGKKVITLFNKMDLVTDSVRAHDPKADFVLKTSLKEDPEQEDLKLILLAILRQEQVYLELIFPYEKAGEVQLIRKYGHLLTEEYTDAGIAVTAYVPREFAGHFKA